MSAFLILCLVPGFANLGPGFDQSGAESKGPRTSGEGSSLTSGIPSEGQRTRMRKEALMRHVCVFLFFFVVGLFVEFNPGWKDWFLLKSV